MPIGFASAAVNDGSRTHDVVCGAWNFEAGALIAYAPVGSRLATNTDQPMGVGSRKIRGVVSHGMIASARELGLGDDHEGILVLDELGAAGHEDLGRPPRGGDRALRRGAGREHHHQPGRLYEASAAWPANWRPTGRYP